MLIGMVLKIKKSQLNGNFNSICIALHAISLSHGHQNLYSVLGTACVPDSLKKVIKKQRTTELIILVKLLMK